MSPALIPQKQKRRKKKMKKGMYFLVGICLFIGMSFLFYGCDNNKSHAQSTVTSPSRVPKPPAAFSNDGEFVGFIIGNGFRTNHVIIYNDEINYRFMIGNGDGKIGYYWSGNPPWGPSYCPDSSCSELYLYQNRLQDVIVGKSDYGDSWPFNSEYVTTEGYNTIAPSELKYKKVWEQKTEPVLTMYSDSTPPPCTTPICPDPMPYPDCSISDDDYGNPLFANNEDPYKCYGYKKVYLHNEDNSSVMTFVCKPVSESERAYLDSLTILHKVIPFDVSKLPFKHPIPVPIDIRVYY